MGLPLGVRAPGTRARAGCQELRTVSFAPSGGNIPPSGASEQVLHLVSEGFFPLRWPGEVGPAMMGRTEQPAGPASTHHRRAAPGPARP